MKQTTEEPIADIPQCLESEFLMSSLDEPIRLASGRFDLLRDGRLMGHLEGEIILDWVPRLRLVCIGEPDANVAQLFDECLVDIRVPNLQLETEALVTNMALGQRHVFQAALTGATNPGLKATNRFRFYLVNFPPFFGELVRTGSGPYAGAVRDRLRMTHGSWICTIDRIRQSSPSAIHRNKLGYALTHVAEVQRPGQAITPKELLSTIDALYWLCAFMRGARTGPVLPSLAIPFANNWISIAPWKVDEPRRVESWMPVLFSANFDSLFAGFIDKWSDKVWNEALRTMIAWYIAANSPSAPSEARIALCQIALEVLASLKHTGGRTAHQRVRQLLESLNVPTHVPSRLQSLCSYVRRLGVDAPEGLTRIRNKFEHPTRDNRRKAGEIDGPTRMQAGQYGLELFELSLLAVMNYKGKYARRAFQGWKGDDEIWVPWV